MTKELPKIATDPVEALKYAKAMKAFPKKYEKVFGKSFDAALDYASLLGSRLPKNVESAIVKCDDVSYEIKQDFIVRYAGHLYALDIDLPKKIERLISNPESLYEYGEITGRIPDYLEIIFIKDLAYAYLYAKNISKRKFPEKIHNMIIAEAIKNPTNQKSASKYFKLCKEFEDIFIVRYEGCPNSLTVEVEYLEYKKLEELSECDQIVYNILKRFSKNKKITEIVKNFKNE